MRSAADLRALLADLRAACPELTILENEPLSRHCSFRIGGPCAAMIAPAPVLMKLRLSKQAMSFSFTS